MKKLYLVCTLILVAIGTKAQTVPGGDMETWRTGTSNGSVSFPTRTIYAPYGWHGLDSLIVAEGEYVASIPFVGFGNGSDYHTQVFHETSIVHGGTSSAKLITVKQDTLGVTGGSIANYSTFFNFSLTGTYSLSFAGGQPVTERMNSVKAWVQYHYPSGADTAVLAVQAIKLIGTVDSVIGSGSVMIDSSSAWQQVSAFITYNDSVTVPDTIRITISSSISGAVDSSVLYVDDVTMNTVVGFEIPVMTGEAVDVYPNPATGVLFVNCNVMGNLNFELYSVSGQRMINKTINGHTSLDISALPAGVYFYNVTNGTGSNVKKGQVVVIQ